MPGENHILVIGIDEYNHTKFYSLNNAVSDALNIQKLLQEVYNFQPTQKPILNSDATRDNILEGLMNLSDVCAKQDNLIIYFAGHGYIDKNTQKGIWVPIDAVDKAVRCITDHDIKDRIDAIDARHVLLISDSCFSGRMFEQYRSALTVEDYNDIDSKRSRWVFYSGMNKVGDGRVGTGSTFSIGIRQFIDINKGRIFSASELFESVRETLEAHNKPLSGFRFLEGANHEDGQMVFRPLSYISSEKLRSPSNKPSFTIPDLISLQYYIPRTLILNGTQRSPGDWIFGIEKNKADLKEIISKQKKVIVLGSAGSGKSVELIQLGKYLQSENSPFVPLFKRFNNYIDEKLEDYLPTGWNQVNPGSLILLLDGLDEIQPEHFNTGVRNINSFAVKNPEIRIIVSCRSNFYELPQNNFSGALDGFEIHHLNDIDRSEVISYTHDHFLMDGNSFMKSVEASNLTGLIQKPYFLDIIIRYYQKHNDLTGKRASIMEETLETYYWQNKEHFKTTSNLPVKEQAFGMIEKISFVMEVMGKNFITDAELVSLFPIKENFENCYFLPAFKRDSEKGQWMFEHNNIQEFLASNVLARQSFETITSIISQSIGGTKK